MLTSLSKTPLQTGCQQTQQALAICSVGCVRVSTSVDRRNTGLVRTISFPTRAVGLVISVLDVRCPQHDEHGSSTALLHLCMKVSQKRFLFFFACLGDTEVMSMVVIEDAYREH